MLAREGNHQLCVVVCVQGCLYVQVTLCTFIVCQYLITASMPVDADLLCCATVWQPRGWCLPWVSGFTAGVMNVRPVHGTMVDRRTSVYHTVDFVAVVRQLFCRKVLQRCRSIRVKLLSPQFLQSLALLQLLRGLMDATFRTAALEQQQQQWTQLLRTEGNPHTCQNLE